MSTCNQCEFFNQVPNDADDYEVGKGDCITEIADEKGKYWLSKPVHHSNSCCAKFNKR